MKIRHGFVTNSSSSSFILSKDSCPIESYDVDSVFKMVKELYIKHEQEFKDIYEVVVAETHGEDISDYFYKLWGYKDANKKFKGKYGVSMIDLSDYERAMEGFKYWRHCKTYAEFVKLMNKKDSPYRHQPFEIINYHDVDKIKDNFTLTETIGWYDYELNHAEDEYDDSIPDTEEGCKEALLKLGEVGIHSECGWIPDFVVEELGKLSAHYCNHMG